MAREVIHHHLPHLQQIHIAVSNSNSSNIMITAHSLHNNNCKSNNIKNECNNSNLHLLVRIQSILTMKCNTNSNNNNALEFHHTTDLEVHLALHNIDLCHLSNLSRKEASCQG